MSYWQGMWETSKIMNYWCDSALQSKKCALKNMQTAQHNAFIANRLLQVIPFHFPSCHMMLLN